MKQGNRSFWDRFAFLYDRVIRKDDAAYREVYALAESALDLNMRVLEVATGTGLFALRIAGKVKSVEATDFSEKMIAVAKAKPAPHNVRFAVADACALPYGNGSFDAVIVSNALHVMPAPELALENIRRVLVPGGLLIAPTFTHGLNSVSGRIRSAFMGAAGFRVFIQWSEGQYRDFVADNGFEVLKTMTFPASFPLTYLEARVKDNG